MPLSKTGEALSRLLQQEVLFSMLKYSSVGATELVSEPGKPCGVNRVLARIKVREGYGVAVLWGRIYEEGDDVFVQSYIRFLRANAPDAIHVGVKLRSGEEMRLAATLPPEGVALAPRRLTRQDIEEIQARVARTLVMRTRPDDAAPGEALVRSRDATLAYSVLDAQGDWMKIQSHTTGQTGWVRARVENEEWALRKFLPELGYFDGVVGFLRMRSAAGLRDLEARRTYRWVERAFTEYEKAVGPHASPTAIGMASAMKGMLLWDEATLGERAARQREAAAMFERARAAMPDSSHVRLLATVTEPLRTSRDGTTSSLFVDLDDGLLGAMAVNPRNMLALRNLEHVYVAWAKQPQTGSYDRDELQQRLRAVKQAQVELAQRTDLPKAPLRYPDDNVLPPPKVSQTTLPQPGRSDDAARLRAERERAREAVASEAAAREREARARQRAAEDARRSAAEQEKRQAAAEDAKRRAAEEAKRRAAAEAQAKALRDKARDERAAQDIKKREEAKGAGVVR
jgi:hypothetical protein